MEEFRNFFGPLNEIDFAEKTDFIQWTEQKKKGQYYQGEVDRKTRKYHGRGLLI